VPAGAGELAHDRRDQPAQRGRGYRAGEQAQAGAAGRSQVIGKAAEEGERLLPAALGAVAEGAAGAVGIIQRQHVGLSEDVRGAKAGGVAQIAFDLDRAAFLNLHQHAAAMAVEVQRRGIDERGIGILAPVADRLGVERGDRGFGAATQAPGGHRCGDELEQRAPVGQWPHGRRLPGQRLAGLLAKVLKRLPKLGISAHLVTCGRWNSR
jgi:hypothetical protein